MEDGGWRMESVLRSLDLPFSIIRPPSTFHRRQPPADLIENQTAGFRRGHAGIVDDLGPEGDHQGCHRALAVALVARREVFPDAVGLTAAGALFQFGVEI